MSVPVFISVSTSVCIITSISASISNSACVSTAMCVLTFVNFCSIMYQLQCGDWGCSLVSRASDWHAFDAGWIPWCGKGFFSQSAFSADSLTVSVHLCVQLHVFTCAHVKDPVIHVRVWWIMETLKHPACTVSWVA